MADLKEIIAKRVAKEFQDGDVVNLGIGIPTMAANYVPEGYDITLHSENGFIGLGYSTDKGSEDMDLVNAGGQHVTVTNGAAFFDSTASFGIVRGGHVDMTVLGALQVDENGDLANWTIPGVMVPGMGGAMDLVVGAKKVIVAMQHTNKGKHKIMKKCNLPLTAVNVVDLIITEMGVIKVTPEGLVLIEINPDYTSEQVQEATGAVLTISTDLKNM